MLACSLVDIRPFVVVGVGGRGVSYLLSLKRVLVTEGCHHFLFSSYSDIYSSWNCISKRIQQLRTLLLLYRSLCTSAAYEVRQLCTIPSSTDTRALQCGVCVEMSSTSACTRSQNTESCSPNLSTSHSVIMHATKLPTFVCYFLCFATCSFVLFSTTFRFCRYWCFSPLLHRRIPE